MDYTIIVFVLEISIFAIVVMATNVIIHEFGHAIPALIITKRKTEIFIGSFGDKDKSFKIKIGLLEIWFKRNPLLWSRGACWHLSASSSINNQIIITGGGPIASLVVAGAAISIFSGLPDHQQIRAMMLPFIYYGIFFFALTVTPIDKKIVLKNGQILFNDGYQLRAMTRLKKYRKNELEAIECYKNYDYKKAAEIFEFLLTQKITYKNIFLNALNAYKAQSDNDGMLRIYNKFSDNFNLSADDYCTIGAIKIAKKMYAAAKNDFEKALTVDPKHIYSLCNIGYYSIVAGDYKKASAYFDEVIALNAEFAYAYGNRGLAKIKLGSIDEGLKDIHFGMELDPSNSYAYRSLGIYYFDEGDYPMALLHLKKAFELDPNTHGITELIAEVEKYLVAKNIEDENNRNKIIE